MCKNHLQFVASQFARGDLEMAAPSPIIAQIVIKRKAGWMQVCTLRLDGQNPIECTFTDAVSVSLCMGQRWQC